MARKTGAQRRASQAAKREERNSATKTKRVKKDGKVYTVSSTDGGKSWSKPKLYSGKAGPFAMVKNPFKKSEKTEKTSKKRNLKIEGTPGSSKGAMAAKAMAKKRIAAGKSTLGEFTGPDRGKKAAQAAAKRRIAAKKAAEKNKKK